MLLSVVCFIMARALIKSVCSVLFSLLTSGFFYYIGRHGLQSRMLYSAYHRVTLTCLRYGTCLRFLLHSPVFIYMYIYNYLYICIYIYCICVYLYISLYVTNSITGKSSYTKMLGSLGDLRYKQYAWCSQSFHTHLCCLSVCFLCVGDWHCRLAILFLYLV